jgi:antirestriction protein ArdC
MTRDLYKEVTDRIISALEAGTPPWVKPWSAEADPLPLNARSKRPYRGINVLLLQLEARARGYSRSRWLTYRQATELGGQVRGGERGTHVVFFKTLEVPSDGSAQDVPTARQVPVLRSYTVFNVAQVDGLPAALQPVPAAPPSWSPHEEAEHLLAASGACIRHGGGRAFYQPAEDCQVRSNIPQKCRSKFPQGRDAVIGRKSDRSLLLSWTAATFWRVRCSR